MYTGRGGESLSYHVAPSPNQQQLIEFDVTARSFLHSQVFLPLSHTHAYTVTYNT